MRAYFNYKTEKQNQKKPTKNPSYFITLCHAQKLRRTNRTRREKVTNCHSINRFTLSYHFCNKTATPKRFLVLIIRCSEIRISPLRGKCSRLPQFVRCRFIWIWLVQLTARVCNSKLDFHSCSFASCFVNHQSLRSTAIVPRMSWFWDWICQKFDVEQLESFNT